MKKGIVIGAIMLALVFSQAVPALAQNTASDLQTLITSLMEQVKVLQEQIQALSSEVVAVRAELKLTRSLYKGVSGDDVTQLQEFLKSDSEVYPEGIVSGYFGPLTERAIKKFQKKHGIESIGIVGPKTRKKLYELLEDGAGKSGHVPSGLLHASGIAKKISSSTTTPLFSSTYRRKISHTESHNEPKHNECKKKVKKEEKHSSGHKDGSGYDNEDGDCIPIGGSDTGTTTPPVVDITAPVISSVGVSGITATSSLASWITDEASDSKIWYATTTPVDVVILPQASSAILELSHGLTLSGLSASTTYYFLVSSSDVLGNMATSTEWSFTTL